MTVNIDWINMREGPILTSAQVAARLGVQIETVYAYVSRGLLVPRSSAGARSIFDALEVEAFAQKRKRLVRAPESNSPNPSPGRPLGVIDSSVTLVEGGRLYFRGLDSDVLARDHEFEQVAEWVWTGSFDATWTGMPGAGERGPGTALDRMRRALLDLGVRESGMYLPDADGAISAGRVVIPELVRCLPAAHDSSADRGIVPQLWSKLSPVRADESLLECLRVALVVLIDHDLAATTLAVRAAASARTTPLAALSVGLASLDSLVHSAYFVQTFRLLELAVREGVTTALTEQSQLSQGVPGFGHASYRGADPRATSILAAAARAPALAATLEVVERLVTLMGERAGVAPNVDLALAALCLGSGMRSDSGSAIFGVARTVGWVAHIVEEYAEPIQRLRPIAHYTGTLPSESAAPSG